MSNRPFSSFHFRLSFLTDPLQLDAAFQEVSGLSIKMDQEEVICGGENRFKYRLPTVPNYQNLMLKRGVTSSYSPLRSWCDEILTGGFQSDDGLLGNILDGGLNCAIKPRNLLLMLLNEGTKHGHRR